MGSGARSDREPTWLSRAHEWLVPPLRPELEPAFQADCTRANVRRLLVLSTLVLVGHAVHVAVFHTTAASRALRAAAAVAPLPDTVGSVR